MGEIRYIIIAKQFEVSGTSLILDGCLKKSFSSVYDLGKQFFGHPSRIDDVPCNLTQFCYIYIYGCVTILNLRGKGHCSIPTLSYFTIIYKSCFSLSKYITYQ